MMYPMEEVKDIFDDGEDVIHVAVFLSIEQGSHNGVMAEVNFKIYFNIIQRTAVNHGESDTIDRLVDH